MHLYISLSRVRSVAFVQILLAGQFLAHAQPVAEKTINEAHKAIIHVGHMAENTRHGMHQCGALLNTDGWAVVSLDMVSSRRLPVFRNSKGKALKFKKVLAVDHLIGIAIVELDYPDSPALGLAAKPPEPWEEIALLWVGRGKVGFYSGPVLARRPQAQYGPGSAEFLCLGMWISRTSSPLSTGSPVINAAGELVGVFDTTELDGPNYPMRVLAVSSDPIAALLKKAKANPQGLPFPLKEAYPYDAAYWEFFLTPVNIAKEKMDEKIARLRELVAKHPDSAWAAEQLLQALLEDIVMLYAKNGGEILDDDRDAPLRNAKMEAYSLSLRKHGHKFRNPFLKFSTKTTPLDLAKDYKKLTDLHLEEVKKWGKSPPLRHLMSLADCYLKQDNSDAAVKYFKEISRVAPDSLYNLYTYQRLLITFGDVDEEKRIGELIQRVEDAYRPR